MSIDTTTYVRKPIYVDALEVTAENFQEVAVWCKGEIKETTTPRGQVIPYIHVPVTRPQHERQEQARVGDWVLTSGRGFKVYTPKAFTDSFDEVNAVAPKVAEPTVHRQPEAICDRCGAPKGLQSVGESCNTNCGGKVISNLRGVESDTKNKYLDTVADVLTAGAVTEEEIRLLKRYRESGTPLERQLDPVAQDEAIAKHRVQAADIRNEAAAGKITAEEAELAVERLPVPEVQPVGTLPMPEQPMPVEDNPEPPKASEVWARVDRGEITGEQARLELGIAPTPVVVQDTLSDTVVVEEPPVGTQPMPEQPEPGDVEDRDRPVPLPPHMGTPREIIGELFLTPEEAERQRLHYENAVMGQFYPDPSTPTEGELSMSTPEDPTAHVGVDLEEDAALKASVDLTDQNTLQAAEEDADQLSGDALTGEDR